MNSQDEADELRYEWGTCAVCGEDAPNWDNEAHKKEYPHSIGIIGINQPQMLCPTHRKQFRDRRAKNFRHWVEGHRDAHLFYHGLGVACPECIPCSGCEENMRLDGDYLCGECRYGY